MILKLKRKKVIEWMYQDADDLESLGREVIDAVISQGSFTIDDNTLGGMLGYVRFDMVENIHEDIDKLKLTETELEHEEILDVSRFEIEWV